MTETNKPIKIIDELTELTKELIDEYKYADAITLLHAIKAIDEKE